MRPGRLGELLSVELPVVQGPFGGGLSSVELTVAVSEGGGLGSYGAHHLAPDGITALVARLKAATDRPFAVNLWVPQEGEPRPDGHHGHEGHGGGASSGSSGDSGDSGDSIDLTGPTSPARPASPTDPTSPPELAALPGLAAHVERLRPYYAELGVAAPTAAELAARPDFDEQLDALIAAAPPAISLVMGLPPRRLVTEARRRGIALIGTATTVAEAVALEASGVDAVVASGSDAGGHRGAFLRPVRESLVGTFSLVPQVADAVAVPVVAAGGIADGRGIAAALALGADAVQIGTAFLAARESGASPVHRRALGGPEARTTVLTRLFSGRTARGIPNRFVRDMAAHEDLVPPYPLQNALMLPIRRAAAEQERADYVNLWAGQAAGLSRPDVRAAELLAALVADADAVADA
ncbi:NAD(P)H-dependent flavin oxidoreductase [Streptomyces sp. NPDC012637]|uniref:NAD(P)H-dependent flavin oxidoreductase n=1 Tax=Streptomyces sp. NPDC012637 TaxID=3364842 RepID=UPI0036EC84BA